MTTFGITNEQAATYTGKSMEEKRDEQFDRYMYCFNMFKKIKQLCVTAGLIKKTTSVKYFIDNGIPAEFMKMCVDAKLCAGGKKGQNLYWNWSKNLIHKNITVDNFLADLRQGRI